jgi:hypothetical protein
VFDQFSGGEVDSEEALYSPGGMAAEISLGGRRTIGNVTVSRYCDRALDWPIIKWLTAQVGVARCTIGYTPLDPSGARRRRAADLLGHAENRHAARARLDRKRRRATRARVHLRRRSASGTPDRDRRGHPSPTLEPDELERRARARRRRRRRRARERARATTRAGRGAAPRPHARAPVGGATTLVIRYRLLPVGEIERFSELQGRITNLALALDMLQSTCVTVLWAEDGETTDLGVRLDGRLWELFGWELPASGMRPEDLTIREIVTGVFGDNGMAVGAHVQEVSEWMAAPDEEQRSPGESLAATS